MNEELFAEPRFLAGVRELNAGNFFEAHEVWEELWLELIGEQKSLIQGLIQIAAGYLKLRLGNTGAARKLWQRGLGRIDACASAAGEAWLQEFISAVQADLARAEIHPEQPAPRLDFEPS